MRFARFSKRMWYYIVLQSGDKTISMIKETFNNLDTVDGLVCETKELEKKRDNVIILNWKKLKKPNNHIELNKEKGD